MKRTKINAVLLGLSLLVGCGNDPAQTDDVGTVGIALVTGGQTINTVSYTVTQSSTTIASGSIDISGPSANSKPSVSLKLPAGSGYTVSLSATTVAGIPCTGSSASFTITAGTSTNVSLTLACTQATSAATKGTANISATTTTNSCPVIGEGWSVSPTTQGLGQYITVSGMTATDADSGQTLTYAWTATGGLLGTWGAPTTAAGGGFQCNATTASSGNLHLVVTDNATPTPCSVSLDIPVACVM